MYFLHEEAQDQLRDNRDQGGGGHLSPEHLLVGDELNGSHGDGKRLSSRKHERIVEGVPAEHETQNDRHRYARQAEGQDHLDQDPPPGTAVNLGRVLHLRGISMKKLRSIQTVKAAR